MAHAIDDRFLGQNVEPALRIAIGVMGHQFVHVVGQRPAPDRLAQREGRLRHASDRRRNGGLDRPARGPGVQIGVQVHGGS